MKNFQQTVSSLFFSMACVALPQSLSGSMGGDPPPAATASFVTIQGSSGSTSFIGQVDSNGKVSVTITVKKVDALGNVVCSNSVRRESTVDPNKKDPQKVVFNDIPDCPDANSLTVSIAIEPKKTGVNLETNIKKCGTDKKNDPNPHGVKAEIKNEIAPMPAGSYFLLGYDEFGNEVWVDQTADLLVRAATTTETSTQ